MLKADMIAGRLQFANAHYSPLTRGLFTAALALSTLAGLAQEIKKSPVVRVLDPQATRFFKPDPARVRAMVEAGLKSVSSKKTAAAAWKTYVSPDDFIGLKVNAQSGAFSGTRLPVVTAVVEGLLRSGVPASRIVIWDRHRADLKRAGYVKLAKKYQVQLAGADDAGYNEWRPYSIRSFVGRLRVGDHLFGKTKYSGDSHLSRLVTEKLTAIICIHSPLYLPRKGASGHLQQLALASADNLRRFEFSYPHFRDAVVGICDGIAFSHSVNLKKLLGAKPPAAAQAWSLFPLGDRQPFFYFEPHSDQAILPGLAFRLAHELAVKEKKPREVRILTKGLVWSQWVLPEGRTVLNHDSWQDEMVAHTKLRFHITDALLCQYHQGQESRPDYAAAINELWFSPDPLALDVMAHRLVAKLRASANLPKGTNPAVLHRGAYQNLLGNIYPEDMIIKSITLPSAAPQENRE